MKNGSEILLLVELVTPGYKLDSISNKFNIRHLTVSELCNIINDTFVILRYNLTWPRAPRCAKKAANCWPEPGLEY